jgi:hypothetical protein
MFHAEFFSLVQFQFQFQSSPAKVTDRQSLIGPHPISAQSTYLVATHLDHRLIAAYRGHLGRSWMSSLTTLGLVNPLDGRQSFHET